MKAHTHDDRRDTVRRLATLRGDPVVSSVYLDVDGAHRPRAATYEDAFERMADELRRRARAREDPRVVGSVDGDIERMRAWLGEGIDRTATRGVAVFSCHEQGWFETVELAVAVRDQAAIGPTPRIRQLVEALDEPEPFLLALVDRTHLRLFHVDGAVTDERPTSVTHQERAVDTTVELGSWEHHQEEAARTHLRRAAAEVDDAVRTWPVRQLVLGGPDESLAALEELLHPTTRALVVGRAGVRVAAPVEEIASAARAVAEQAERDREVALVEAVRQRAAGEHGGVVGLEATLAALAEQRVATLLVRDGFSAPGASCPACGHTGPDLRQCPVCRATNVELDDVVEVAIEQAVAQGADVELCRGTEIDRFGSIAAIERY
jgi:peptide subunit release factor 1 (eRF1)